MISDSFLESDEEENEEEDENKRGPPLAKLCILKNEHVPETGERLTAAFITSLFSDIINGSCLCSSHNGFSPSPRVAPVFGK